MKKITTLFLLFNALVGFSQSKSTGDIALTTGMTANFTLNNNTSKVTLILKGSSESWFALGIGVEDGFNMGSGDVLVYTTALTDRHYIGFQAPASDTNQNWTTISNTVADGTRTLTLERALTNSDSEDFQMAYNATNKIDLAWAKDRDKSTSLRNHTGAFRGFATGTFTALGLEDFSLQATSIYPIPSSDLFFIKAKTNLTKVTLYNQVGALLKTMEVTNNLKEIELKLNGIQAGVYFIELQNETEKSWKKVVVE